MLLVHIYHLHNSLVQYLALTQYGIIGLILIQGIVQGCYANWKWPYKVCKEFEISFISFIKLGVFESINQIKLNIYGR